MTFVRAWCRNGDLHIGHLDAWGPGWASIGGTHIDGVVAVTTLDPGGVTHDGAPAAGVDSVTAHPGAEGLLAPAVLSPPASPTHVAVPSTGRESTGGRGEPDGGRVAPDAPATPSHTHEEAPALLSQPGA